jgi:hypothetical protein
MYRRSGRVFLIQAFPRTAGAVPEMVFNNCQTAPTFAYASVL